MASQENILAEVPCQFGLVGEVDPGVLAAHVVGAVE
jgi:hypothetical protein